MPWFWFILMLMTLLLGNSAGASHSLGVWLQGMTKSEPNLLVLMGPMLLVLLLTKVWMVYIGRYVENEELSFEAAAKMWEQGLSWATVVGATAIIFLEPLAGITYRVQQAREYSESLATLMALVPVLLFALVMDSLAYQWEQYVFENASQSDGAKLEQPHSFLWRRAQFQWLLPVVPIMISCLGVDLLKLVVTESVLERWAIFFVPALSILVAGLVGWILLSVSTASLPKDHPHAGKWRELFREVGAPIRELRILRTGNRMNNAMLIGFLPRWRYVILTDKLLATLSMRELEMVLLHEAAHSKCRHGLKRFLVVISGLALLALVFRAWGFTLGLVSTWNAADSANMWIWQIVFWGGVGCMLGLCIGVVRAVKWIWHSTELEADRVACELSVRVRQIEYFVPQPTEVTAWNVRRQHWKSAMELSAALYNLVGDEKRAARDTWTHPSVKSRVQKLADLFAFADG